MKENATIGKSSAAGYHKPTVEAINILAERGFEASLPGVGIDPWGSDNDSLEL